MDIGLLIDIKNSELEYVNNISDDRIEKAIEKAVINYHNDLEMLVLDNSRELFEVAKVS